MASDVDTYHETGSGRTAGGQRGASSTHEDKAEAQARPEMAADRGVEL